MRPDVASDLSDSAHDFLRVVWPVVKDWCRGGELKPVESVAPKEFEKQLDTLAGIDAWQIVDGAGIRGIASRVQWIKAEHSWRWRTFTIRKSRSTGTTTEWSKRIEALKDTRSGFIRPSLIVHAYVQLPRRKGDLKYACMCRADDLFSLATDDLKGRAWYEKANPNDGNTFAVFPARALKAHGVKVYSYPQDDAA